ncbi:MAG: hypothetical protein M0Q49_02275 [Porticoccaceae bacterium]|jgi:hypothetical protein|nr:hypothetical protein [Porticoccaceae bacterium]
MTTQQRIIIANLAGIVVLALGMYGINVDAETQKLIVGGLGAIGTVINMTIVQFRSRQTLLADEMDAFHQREGGYVRPSLCFALAAVVIVATALFSGCGHAPETPRQAIAASYVTVETVADAAEIAYRDGHIDADQRAVIRADLQSAIEVLAEARRIESAGGDAADKLQYVRAVLMSVQKLLPEVPHE